MSHHVKFFKKNTSTRNLVDSNYAWVLKYCCLYPAHLRPEYISHTLKFEQFLAVWDDWARLNVLTVLAMPAALNLNHQKVASEEINVSVLDIGLITIGKILSGVYIWNHDRQLLDLG